MFKIKRAYEPAARGDGLRILIDRLWPRGLKKEEMKLHLWMKDVAPSTQLRTWFGHDAKRWEAFGKKYKDELNGHPHELEYLRRLAEGHTVTLVYGAKDEQHNHARILKVVLSGA